MINANELRLGNWIKNGFNHPIKINSIISEGNTGGYALKTLSPIPLTAEILEKAGFEKTGRYAIGAGGYITYEKDRVVLLHPKSDPFVLAFHETQVQSVHQLQNLYFALTGQELEISL